MVAAVFALLLVLSGAIFFGRHYDVPLLSAMMLVNVLFALSASSILVALNSKGTLSVGPVGRCVIGFLFYAAFVGVAGTTLTVESTTPYWGYMNAVGGSIAVAVVIGFLHLFLSLIPTKRGT